MAVRLKKHIDELKVLKKAKRKLRQNILEAADNQLIRCLCECCYNVLNGNVKLSQKQKKTLQKHKHHLRNLSAKKTSQKKRRAILVQNGGFLPALLAPILSVATTLISQLLNGPSS
jgi:SAM-dependent MidA family methyltransferase